MIKILSIVKIIFSIICFSGFVFAAQPQSQKLELNYFFSPTCQSCHEVKEMIISRIEQKYNDKVRINFRDISVIENYKLFLALKEKYGLSGGGPVPAVYFSGRLLSGEKEIFQSLINSIDDELAKGHFQPRDNPEINLLKHFFSFTPVTLISAGLIDGVNPCAFSVIVFFISFLALQQYQKREIALVGLVFIFSVFLTYLLLGLGLLSFFYSIKGFWLARKIFNLGVGSLSVVFGVMAVVDSVKFKITGKTEGMSLQLPLPIKNQIHRVIGVCFRKDKIVSSQMLARAALPAVEPRVIRKLLITALISGFLVSILEAVCTGQVYLPTIAFVFKTTNIKIKAFAYLILYNLMFILPLFVVFLCAFMGITSEDFARFFKKHFLITKILMAILFFVLGVYLWRG